MLPRVLAIFLLGLCRTVWTITLSRKQMLMIGSDMGSGSSKQPEISWGTNSTHIEIQLAYPTLGWIAFGLSPNGGMDQTDVLFAYVDDRTREVVVQDRYIVAPTEQSVNLSLDTQQDWVRVSGSQNGTHTTVRAARKLKTCDAADRPFTDSSVPVIFSWNTNDPQSKTGPIRKHNQRGGAQINFLQSRSPMRPSERIVQTMNFTMGNVNIEPSETTNYLCRLMKMPTLTRKLHAVMVSPIVDPRNVDLLHHLVLNVCTRRPEVPGDTFACDIGSTTMNDCQVGIGGWATGGESITYPSEAGLPFTPDMSGKYIVLQAHYNNPNMRGGVDNSGFSFSLTDQLRKYDIESLATGVLNLNYVLTLPPGQDAFTVSSHCSDQCTRMLPEDGVNIISALIHMHTRGRIGIARHFRGNQELPPLIKNLNYDYNYQTPITISPPRKFLPGDRIVTECTFSTKAEQPDQFIFGGEGTSEEMCLGVFDYYPRTNVTVCASYYNLPGYLKAIEMPANLIYQAGLPKKPNQSVMQALTSEDVGDRVRVKQLERGVTAFIRSSRFRSKQVENLREYYRSKQFIGMCDAMESWVIRDNPPFIEPFQDFSAFNESC